MKARLEASTGLKMILDFWRVPSAFLEKVQIQEPTPEQLKPVYGLYKLEEGFFLTACLSDAPHLPPAPGTVISKLYNLEGKVAGEITFVPSLKQLYLPFRIEDVIQGFIYERYLHPTLSSSLARKGYYIVRPLMPRALQILFRRILAGLQARREFPRWPIEDSLTQFYYFMLVLIISISEESTLPMISFWPQGKLFSLVLTHDVETEKGLSQIPALLEIEEKFGFRSSWNFVPERYKIDTSLIKNLREKGFEIGVHGLKHDGKLFNSWNIFQERANKINEYIERWEAEGFRAPSAIHNLHWLRELRIHYDSSLPSNEIYGPQPGGCCCVFPFTINGMVELPITLQQDHTLFEILKDETARNWLETIESIISLNGLILIITHPDYMFSSRRLQIYETTLKALAEKKNYWHALPKEMAQWWRDREASRVHFEAGKTIIKGPAAERAVIWQLSLKKNENNRPYIHIQT